MKWLFSLVTALLFLISDAWAQSAISRVFSYGFQSVNVPVGETGLSAVPYNPPEGGSYSVSPRDASVTINADTGRLAFVSTTPVARQEYTIVVSVGDKQTVTKIFVEFKSGVSGSIASYFSLGYFDSYQFVVGVPMVLPVYLNGAPTSCSVSPALPQGMSFDSNGLSGAPSVVSQTEVEYTFQCQNEVSVTNSVVFTTSVHSSPIQGILGTYFRYDGANALSCSPNVPYNAFHTKDSKIELQKVETNIGHEATESAISWDETTDLIKEWGASWVGYLLVDNSDNYTFGTETDDGNWIFIDGQMIMDVSSCRPAKPIVLTYEIYLSAGYHHIVVNYFQKGGPNALVLYWWRRNVELIYSKIPDENLYFVPRTPLTYSYSYNSLLFEQSNVLFKPVLFDISGLSNYQVSPPLMGGLTLNPTTGEITGVPTADTSNVDIEYTITAQASGKTYSTKIYLDVKDNSKAFALTPYWSVMEIYKMSELYIINGSFIDLRFLIRGLINELTLDGKSSGYTVPGTSQSFVFDNNWRGVSFGGFYGQCKAAFGEQTLHFIATTTEGNSVSYDQKFTCAESCPMGKFTLEVQARGYETQSYEGFSYRVVDVGGNIILATSAKNDGYDSRISRCVTTGTYYVTGVYNNDNIQDRPRLEIYVDRTLFTTVYGSARSLSSSFVVGTVYCTEADGFKQTKIGEVAHKSCDSGKIGKIERTCGYRNDAPTWYNILDTCRSPIPPSGLTYGFTKVTIPLGRQMKFSPKFDGDAKAFSISPTTEGIILNPDTGVLTLLQSSPSAAVEYTISASYETRSTATLVEIAFDSNVLSENVYGLKVGYYDSYEFLVNAPISIPFTYEGGYPDVCKISPQLPTGLRLLAGGIFGLPTTESPIPEVYEISCENTASITNKVYLTAAVHSIAVPGIIATYSKLLGNAALSCDAFYNALTQPNSYQDVSQIEKKINHPYINDFSSWDGLPAIFREQFFLTYDFYLMVTMEGVHSFSLDSSKGSWLLVDGEQVIDNSGCHNMQAKTGDIALSKGYHLVNVHYFNTNGGDGIILQWRLPNQATYVDIGESSMFFIPRSILDYTIRKASYVVNVAITPNSPIVYDTTAISYSITPELPTGLSLDKTTGVITGTPTVHTNKVDQTYIVSALMSTGRTESTTLIIDVYDFQPPFGFQVSYTGSTVAVADKPIQMFVDTTISLSISARGGVSKYSIAPDLPTGLAFSENTGILSGTCKSPFDVVFSVGAVNDGGLASVSFHLFCSDSCTESNYEPIGIRVRNIAGLTYDYNIAVGSGQSQIVISKTDVSIPAVYSGCFLATQPLPITGSNKNLYPVVLDFYLVRQSFKSYSTPVGAGEYSTPFVTSIALNFEKPTIALDETDYSYYTDQEIMIKPRVTGLVTRATVTPPLPDGVYINQEDISVVGAAKFRSDRTEYTLSVGTASGTNSVRFHLTIKDCFTSNQVPTILLFKTGDVDASGYGFSLKSNGVPIISSVGQVFKNNTQYQFFNCSSVESFSLELTDSRGLRWDPVTYLQVRISDLDLGKYHKTEGSTIVQQPTQQIQLPALAFAVSPVGTWRYAHKYPGIGWNNVSFAEGTMQESTLIGITQYNGQTIYLRTPVIRSNDMDALGVMLKLRHVSGCIAYVNGREIYRRNMLSGLVTDTTWASKTFGSMTEVQLFFPRTLLSAENNVIALEFHRYSSDTTNFDLSLSAIYESTDKDCMDMSGSGTIVSSSGGSDPLNPVQNAFDNDTSTKWIEMTSKTEGTAVVEYTFGENKYVWFDTYGIRSSMDAMSYKDKNPTKVLVEISDDYGSQQLGQYAFTIVADNQPVTTTIADHFRLAKTIRLTILERVSVLADTQISEVLLQACHKAYCSATGVFPVAERGTTVNVTCEKGYTGYRLRTCSSNRYPVWGEPDVSNCVIGPPESLEYPFSQYTFTKGTNIGTEVYPTVFAIGTVTYSIAPLPPLQLSFNPSTGALTGEVIAKSPATIYTVTAKNSVGFTNFRLSIEVVAIECPAAAYWEPVEKGKVSSIDCNGGFVGKRHRICSNETVPKWLDIDDTGCKRTRDPAVPASGEVYLYGPVIVSGLPSPNKMDSVFFDYLRMEITKKVSLTDPQTIMIFEGASDDLSDSYLLDLYVITTKDTTQQVKDELIAAFDSGQLSLSVGSYYKTMTLSLLYTFQKSIVYVPPKNNNVLTIVLSSVFGAILLVIVGLCVYCRCKSRVSRKKHGSMKLATTGHATDSARSMRIKGEGAGRGSARAVARSVRL